MRTLTAEELLFRRVFESWCLHVGAPLPTEYLTFLEEMPDRCVFPAGGGFLEWIEAAAKPGPGRRLRRWRFRIGKHRPWKRVKTARKGWRCLRVVYSVQLVLHELPDHPAQFVEADVDVFNPAWRSGVVMPFAHFVGDYLKHRIVKLFGRRKGHVSPFDVAAAFGRDGIKVLEV